MRFSLRSLLVGFLLAAALLALIGQLWQLATLDYQNRVFWTRSCQADIDRLEAEGSRKDPEREQERQRELMWLRQQLDYQRD